MAKNTRAAGKPWADPDDAPEWTEEMVARAEISEGDKIIRRGWPPLGGKAKEGRVKPGHGQKRAI
jgi:hypothetical protein